MAGESKLKKLTRVRPPCVQISYELQTGEAIEIEEFHSVLDVRRPETLKTGAACPIEGEGDSK